MLQYLLQELWPDKDRHCQNKNTQFQVTMLSTVYTVKAKQGLRRTWEVYCNLQGPIQSVASHYRKSPFGLA